MTACSQSSRAPVEEAPPARAVEVPAFSHIFLVVMENLGYRQALAVPALARLAHRYAFASQSYAVAHPSLPNYLALASGSTRGVTSDCWFCYFPGPDLATELQRAGISWAAYLEGLPGPGWLGPYWPFTSYAGKHDPWRYFLDVRGHPRLAAHLLPLSRLYPLLAGPAAKVPRFVWVTPNLCHDGHDCPAAEAALWLSDFVQKVTASPAWRQGGVLFVTWDEGSGQDTRGVDSQGALEPRGGGGHILTLVVAPHLPRGEVISRPLNHYSLLKTIEEAFGLPLLGATASRGIATYAPLWQKAR